MNEADNQIARKTRNVKRFKDESGKVYSKLTVLRFAGKSSLRAALFACRCECGNEIVVLGSSLRTGNTKSCGFCEAGDHVVRIRKHHGLADTPEYEAWRAMRSRCYVKSTSHFERYGGRGITVCDEWKNDFSAFYVHVGPRPTPRHSIHRKDNDGNYEPGNVKWATKREQCNTRSSNRVLEHAGKSQTLSQWSRETGLNCSTIWLRIKAGWSVERALTSPVQRLKRKLA